MKRRFLNKTYLVLGGMVGVTMLTGGILTLPGAKADDSVVSTATITVPVSCTMSGTGMNSHTASIENGRKVEGIGTTDIKAFCNDSEGFSIYAVGFTGDTIGNTYLRDTTLGQTDDILTSTTLSGNTSAWAMKLGVTSGTYTPIIAGSTADSEKQAGDTDYSDWAAVPASYQRVAYRNSATDLDNGSTAEGAQLSTTYAAYISPTQKAGTYMGKVKYTLVHPANDIPAQPQSTRAGKACYYPNGGNVEGTMGCDSIWDSTTSLRLLVSNFSREGYGFAGWSTTYDYSDPTGFYGPNEDITFAAGQYTGDNPGLSLYAHWIKSAGLLQSWNGCSGLTIGSVTALKDQRDNNTYAVAKLSDGNCWMIENMRLNNTNSDNAVGILAQGYGGQFAGLAASEEPGWPVNSSAANSLYSIDGADNTINIGTSNAANRFPRYSRINTPTNASDRPQNPSTGDEGSQSGAGMYNYGNYYSWPASIADTTDYTTNNYSVTSTSICPYGWHLPKGGDETNEADNEFWALIVTGINGGITPANYQSNIRPHYSGTAEASSVDKALRAYPNNFVRAGSPSADYVGERGSTGYYWTSTVGSGNFANGFYFNYYGVAPGNETFSKYLGYSIRCVISGT